MSSLGLLVSAVVAGGATWFLSETQPALIALILGLLCGFGFFAGLNILIKFFSRGGGRPSRAPSNPTASGPRPTGRRSPVSPGSSSAASRQNPTTPPRKKPETPATARKPEVEQGTKRVIDEVAGVVTGVATAVEAAAKREIEAAERAAAARDDVSASKKNVTEAANDLATAKQNQATAEKTETKATKAVEDAKSAVTTGEGAVVTASANLQAKKEQAAKAAESLKRTKEAAEETAKRQKEQNGTITKENEDKINEWANRVEFNFLVRKSQNKSLDEVPKDQEDVPDLVIESLKRVRNEIDSGDPAENQRRLSELATLMNAGGKTKFKINLNASIPAAAKLMAKSNNELLRPSKDLLERAKKSEFVLKPEDMDWYIRARSTDAKIASTTVYEELKIGKLSLTKIQTSSIYDGQVTKAQAELDNARKAETDAGAKLTDAESLRNKAKTGLTLAEGTLRTARTERTQMTERTEMAERTERAARTEMAERTATAETAERTASAATVERTAATEAAEKTAATEKAAATEAAERTAATEKAAVREKTEKAEALRRAEEAALAAAAEGTAVAQTTARTNTATGVSRAG